MASPNLLLLVPVLANLAWFVAWLIGLVPGYRVWVDGAWCLAVFTVAGGVVYSYEQERRIVAAEREANGGLPTPGCRTRTTEVDVAEKSAEKRGTELLRRFCTDEQMADFANYRHIRVRVDSGSYVISPYGVIKVEQGDHICSWCVTPSHYPLPDADRILTLKLWLEERPHEFFQIAIPL